MADGRLVKTCGGIAEGTRGRSRPRRRWTDAGNETLKAKCVSDEVGGGIAVDSV